MRATKSSATWRSTTRPSSAEFSVRGCPILAFLWLGWERKNCLLAALRKNGLLAASRRGTASAVPQRAKKWGALASEVDSSKRVPHSNRLWLSGVFVLITITIGCPTLVAFRSREGGKDKTWVPHSGHLLARVGPFARPTNTRAPLAQCAAFPSIHYSLITYHYL